MKREAEKQIRRESGDGDEDRDDDESAPLAVMPQTTEKRVIRGLPNRNKPATPAASPAPAANDAPKLFNFTGGFGQPATKPFSFKPGSASPAGAKKLATAAATPAKPASPSLSFDAGKSPANTFSNGTGFSFPPAPTNGNASSAAASPAPAAFPFTPAASSSAPKAPTTAAASVEAEQASKATGAGEEAAGTPSTASASTHDDDASSKYYLSLRGLNHSLCKALSKALGLTAPADGPQGDIAFADLTPVLRSALESYEKHRREVDKSRPPSKEASGSNGSDAASKAPVTNSSASTKPSTSDVTSSAPSSLPGLPTFTPPAGGFSFGDGPAPKPSSNTATAQPLPGQPTFAPLSSVTFGGKTIKASTPVEPATATPVASSSTSAPAPASSSSFSGLATVPSAAMGLSFGSASNPAAGTSVAPNFSFGSSSSGSGSSTTPQMLPTSFTFGAGTGPGGFGSSSTSAVAPSSMPFRFGFGSSPSTSKGEDGEGGPTSFAHTAGVTQPGVFGGFGGQIKFGDAKDKEGEKEEQ